MWELIQKLVFMVIQFAVIAIVGAGLGALVKWCNSPPQTTEKGVVLHIVAVIMIIFVFAAIIWMIRSL